MRQCSRWLCRIAVLTMLVSALVLPARAEEPTGFAEFAWNTSLTTLLAECAIPTLPPRPFTSSSGVTILHCSAKRIEIGAYTPAPDFFFIEDGLAAYDISISWQAYSRLRRLAIEKFGSPTRITTEHYTTGVGRSLTGEVLQWIWPTGSQAILVERSGKTTISSLTVMTRRYLDHLAKHEQERLEKTKKSF